MVEEPGAANPLFVNASAFATILPSGDRDSVVHLGAALQPENKKSAPRISGKINLSAEEDLSRLRPLIKFMVAPMVVTL